MLESPASLVQFCLDYIAKNLKDSEDQDLVDAQLITTEKEANLDRLKTQLINVKWSPLLLERFLTEISKRGYMYLDCVLKIFSTNKNKLEYVTILHNPSKRYEFLLFDFCQMHNIRQFYARGMYVFKETHTMENIFNLWTLQNMTHLYIPKAVFKTSINLNTGSFFSQMHNLTTLDLSGTVLNNKGLVSLVNQLVHLQNLNISETEVSNLAPMQKWQNTLTHLSLYNVPIKEGKESLFALRKLVHLDISQDFVATNEINSLKTEMVVDILSLPQRYPYLKSLDLSGCCVPLPFLISFLEKKSFAMEFLGLFQTFECFSDIFRDSEFARNCTIAGLATEAQLLASLNAYTDRRNPVAFALRRFFECAQDRLINPTYCVKVLLKAIEANLKDEKVSALGSACLFNLIKENATRLHPFWLGKIADITINIVDLHLRADIKNALLTLCSLSVVKEIVFDVLRVTKLMVSILINCRSNRGFLKLAIILLSVFMTKIKKTEMLAIARTYPQMFDSLLDIIRYYSQPRYDTNTVLNYALTSLWNLTDESPYMCRIFLERNGFAVYSTLYVRLKDSPCIVRSILGLISNIAEVPELRHNIMRGRFLDMVIISLHSESIDVSYFSACILSFLMCGSLEIDWNSHSHVKRKDVAIDLGRVVASWDLDCDVFVTYRSLVPFAEILRNFTCPESQLWALWAIYHYYLKTGAAKLFQLMQEEIFLIIRDIYAHYNRFYPADDDSFGNTFADFDFEKNSAPNEIVYFEQIDGFQLVRIKSISDLSENCEVFEEQPAFEPDNRINHGNRNSESNSFELSSELQAQSSNISSDSEEFIDENYSLIRKLSKDLLDLLVELPIYKNL